MFLTEWNVPIVTISGNSRKLSDKEKYPTVISMSPSDNFMMAIFVKTTLERFRWTNVFLLCDKGDRVVPFYIAMCAIFKNLLRPADGQFTLYDVSIKSVDSHQADLDLMLEEIASRSRVVIVLTNAVVMRQLMIQAQRRNMTNGEYVYFFMQPFLLLNVFSDFSWRLDKDDDLLALEAFRVVFYMITDTETLAQNIPTNTRDEMVNRMQSYSLCKERTTATVEMFAAYEAVTLLAKVARDIVQKARLNNKQPNFVGTTFVKELSNRTHDLLRESTNFDINACKIPDFLIKQFNSTSKSFENVILFCGKDNTSSFSFNRNLTWPGGHLPETKPRCGFDGSNNECRTNSTATILVSTVLVAAVLLITLLGVLVCFRYKFRFLKFL
ncbi:hypothetical protein RvY_16919-2 [Ramazzottius varieornatus]|uniref:Receptor ligand binding region domain-containing protein n=1 Tax=Ramazzottius varieornatus TaxID=947166 RepID=A0A1D1W7G8_RAMVA|nr:hypothetical protein RvY_16919-2 [Ramazzottius varieornatus]